MSSHRRWLGILLSIHGICACSGSSGAEKKTDASAPVPDSSISEDPGGPVFLSFGSDVPELSAGQSVTFTVVLTDPDGIDDLIGGSLKSEDGKSTYGAFVTSGQEGSYSLTVGWAQMNRVEPIDFRG